MQRMPTIVEWWTSRINPEKLWMHYAVALAIVIGLLSSIHFVSDAIVQQGEFASDTVEAIGGQTVLSQEILLLAISLADADGTEFAELAETTTQFETTHLVLLQGDIWSDALQKHYFSGASPLNAQIREFADLAHQLVVYPSGERAAVADRLRELHGSAGLFDALKTSVALFEAEAEAETSRLQNLLGSILAFSAVILVAEALFIFLPAQLTVKSVIKELRTKTEVLSGSQNQLRRMNDKLHHMINHDQLTGLPNRAYMTSHINQIIKQDQSVETGILFVGLDGFKTMNDTIGYENGDKLLIEVAERLRFCVDDDDLFARIGGDEFILTTSETPETLTKRILAALSDPITIDDRNINVSASIGYLTAYLGNYDPDQILGNAGLALQAAKLAGGRQAVAFSDALREEVATFRQLQLELRDAITSGQIEPWFQPQINLAEGTLHGAEVLARWRHPTRGLLTPDKFLPAAERAGLTVELDHAIWQSAIACASHWQTEGIWRPTISLNAAPDTIADPYLIERLLKQMHLTALDSDQIVVEVLETTLIESADDMAAINIDSLAECGISLELDDFGTGYASLSKLTQLPLAGIKIDKSLIAPLPATGADSVVRAILALASELGLLVVAEGIEEIEQADHLTACGCAVGQGYGFARPMPAEDFNIWLTDNAGKKLTAGRASTQFPMRA